MSHPSSDDSRLRLDDLFRTVVHLRPDTAFDVIAPDLVQGVRSPVSFTRLDTQLASARLLPDIAYLLDGDGVPSVLVVEGQARAKHQRITRATSIAMAYGQSAPTGERKFELRLIELRTGARSRLAGNPHPGPTGRLRFEPSNALLDLDPADARFQHPETWTLLAFSRKVTAAHLDQLMARLAAVVQPGHSPRATVTSTDVHLLGAIGRVRFPEYPWSHQAQESYVNDTLNIQSSDSGHLTPDEILQLEIQAANERRRVLAEMERAAEERGAAEARREAQNELMRREAQARRELDEREAQAEARARRELLMKMAKRLAPDRLSEFAAFQSVAELEREVMALMPGAE